MVRLHRFFDLLSGRPYRFRVRQLHIDYPTKNITTPWSWPKILATTVPKEWRRHEYAQFHVRGTGLNNHNSTVFKIDDNVILEHVYFMGLYLAVIDRRDLSLVEHAFYNTSTFKINPAAGKDDSPFAFTRDGFTAIDDFGIANDMAKRIRAYDYNYFIVVASQHSWEQQFSKELGETLMHCGALNIMEMTNHFSPRFGNSTKFLNIYDTN